MNFNTFLTESVEARITYFFKKLVDETQISQPLEKPELFRRSLARHLLVYATQRGTGPADDDLLHKMSKDTITLSEMIELIVLSDSFLQQGPESSGLGINP